MTVPWRHARSRVGHCRYPRRERQGKGQLLSPRMDLWLQPWREQGRPCRAPHRERQGKGRLLLLSLGLWLRPQGGQGQHCWYPRRERQGKGQLLPPRLGLWLQRRRAQVRLHLLAEEEQGRGKFYLARLRREGQGHLEFEPPACCRDL